MNDNYDYISINESSLVQAINESFKSFGKVIKIETIKKEPLSKRKKFYKILFNNNKWAHLTIAQNLTSQYDKTKRFNELYPDISCKALFIIKFSNFDVLGQEYFDGFSIDHLITNSLITQKEVFCIYNEIYHSYNENLLVSSSEKMLNELKTLKKNLYQLPIFKNKEKCFLDDIFNSLEEDINKLPSHKLRYSQGDLTPSNILIKNNFEFKIIDCEFAKFTNFIEDDFFRLLIHSKFLHKNYTNILEEKLVKYKFINVFYYLNQIYISSITSESYKDYHLHFDITNLFNLHQKRSKTESVLLESLTKAYNFSNKTKDCIIDKKNIVIKSLDRKVSDFSNKNHQLELHKMKIDHMKSSFSWISTMPFRFLRRKFIDPVKFNDKTISTNEYSKWVRKYDFIDNNRLNIFKNEYNNLKNKPLFSIILPVHNTNLRYLKDTIKSVFNQVYKNWELCIIDDYSNSQKLKDYLKYISYRENLKVKFSKKRLNISESTNIALSDAKGEYIIFLDHDDLLRPHSLLRVAQKIKEHPWAKILYTDEDKIDSLGRRQSPFFKPDWSPDLFLTQNFICHLLCVKKSHLNLAGGFRKKFDGCQDWDLVLRLLEYTLYCEIIHIPEVLYHWRMSATSCAKSIDAKEGISVLSKGLVNEYFKNNNINASVKILNNSYLKINYISKIRKLTIIVPTFNSGVILHNCINSILEKTNYNVNYDILIVNNESYENETLKYLDIVSKHKCVNVIDFPQPFNYSLINNFAASRVDSDLLLFLNDDVEVTSEEWLTELATNASRASIGAVGAKLIYPKGNIQHAGIVLGINGVAGHIFKGYEKNHNGQMNRINLTHNVSAVTGACLCIDHNKFDEVGGFDDENLKVAFNDVDLCMKLTNHGYYNLIVPSVVLVHHESYTRGMEDTKNKKQRFAKEIKFMQNKWGVKLLNDPFYNPNLSLDNEQCMFTMKR